jgi:REP element-mobilizing transposase RayT
MKEGNTMHSFISCLLHCVWATRERRPLIKTDLQSRLWPYLGGVARQNQMKALFVGGVEDHVHALLSLPSTLSVAKAIQLLKGNSSKWISDTFQEHRDFEWQEGYGAFSIGISGAEHTMNYIRGQAEHHRNITFKQEVEAFLRKHAMEFVDHDLE